MDYYFMAFASITTATRVKEYFQFDKDYLALMHTPKGIPVNGCSYCLKFKKGKLAGVLKAVYAMNLKILGVFEQNENNEYVQVMI